MTGRGKHPYVTERNGVFHYRRRVPRGAEARFGGRREFVRTLKARTWREAQAELAVVIAEFERLARPPEQIRPSVLSTGRGLEPSPLDGFVPSALESRIRARFAEQWREVSSDLAETAFRDVAGQIIRHQGYASSIQERLIAKDPEPDWLVAAGGILRELGAHPAEAAVLMRQVALLWGAAELEMMLRRIAYFQGRAGAEFNTSFGAEAFAKDAIASRSMTVEAAAKRFLSDPLREFSPTTLQQYSPRLKTIVEGLGPKKALRDITKADCRRLQEEVILQLPANRTKKYPKAPLMEAIQRGAADGVKVISPKTQRLYTEVLKSFFKWASMDDLIEASPAIVLRAPKGDNGGREHFTPEQLQVIFDAPIFTGCQDDRNGYARPGPARPRRHRFWIPLIALYSGMRQEEIALLRVRDIVREWGVDAFNLVEDRKAGRTLKTRGSVRKVPIHLRIPTHFGA
ncbi:MAG: hypothetical protein KGS44_14480 [Alphaproteobacteria bacterium]|nr:hypothetical protein [Alphaproteobacteria bacterium]